MTDPVREFYLNARDYDLISGHGVAGDIAYFSRLAEKSRSVLELACGTGRVTWPMARAGARVTALDLVGEMLALAREKGGSESAAVQGRVRLLEADMRAFGLGKRFPLIVIPFRAFQHLLTVEEQMDCLACCRKHLTRQGRLVINLFDPNLRILAAHMQSGLPGPVTRVETRLDGDEKLIVWSSRTLSPEQQRMQDQWVVERFDAQGRSVSRRLHTLTLRWFYRFEMEHLFARCGFRVLSLEGGFDGQPFTHGQEQVWTLGLA